MAGGTGTKEDPWLIETNAEFSTMLRAAAQTGYYRAAGDLSVELGNAPLPGSNYACKVLDMQGYRAVIRHTAPSSGAPVIAGIMFVNGLVEIYSYPTADYFTVRPMNNCFFTDCVLLIYAPNGFQRTFDPSVQAVSGGWASLEPQEWRRVLFVVDGFGSGSNKFETFANRGGTQFISVFKWTGTATSPWFTRTTSPALSALDAATGGEFTAAGWFDDTTLGPVPIARSFFADVINFVVSTLVDGEPTSRQLMYEHDGQAYNLGVSDAGGILDVTLRLRRFLTLRVVATEDYALERMQNGNYIRAGQYLLPPADNGRKYQASSAGQLTNLQSVTFGASPVVVNGITLTPAPVYQEMASPRTTLQTGGPQQFITLDTADMGGGGGGPVLDGDPAYLDGVVEEIHPTLGTVRPLANAEVVVVEMRSTGTYAAMGRALTNLLGEFRVNTEVYGGGDVFAFAVDFQGLTWQPGIELGIGARVRPTADNGYVYEVVSGGVSGTFEPTWWADAGDGTEGFIGTARAKARPYYQPQAHGPLKMTLIT